MKRTKPILTYTCFNCYSQIQDKSLENKELNKILTPFQHSNSVKITYHHVIFFTKREYRADFDINLFVNVKCRKNHEWSRHKIYDSSIHRNITSSVCISKYHIFYFKIKSSFSQNLYLQNQVYYDIFILFEQDVYGIIFLMFYALS